MAPWFCELGKQDRAAMEATQGQIDGFFSQLPYKCHQNRVASVGDWLQICPWVASRVVYQKIPNRYPSR